VLPSQPEEFGFNRSKRRKQKNTGDRFQGHWERNQMIWLMPHLPLRCLRLLLFNASFDLSQVDGTRAPVKTPADLLKNSMFVKSLWLSSIAAALLLLSGCGLKDEVHYPARGVVKELKPNGKTVVVAHEEIPDYMEAMTMDFDVKNKGELAGLKPGDYISFTLVVKKDDGWIEGIGKLPPPTPTNASQVITMPDTNTTNAVTYRRSPIVEPLNIGDAVPDYKFTNQFGTPISLAQFKGRALALTFIFTRCPFPTFCPRMSQNFQKAEKALKAKKDAPQNWSLLSVSFDPAYDTPERLNKYAAAYNIDTNHWQFVTSDLWTIDGITEQVGLTFFRETPTALPQHNLRTIVIDARGRMQKVFVGNEWTTDEFVEEIVKAAGVK
jgi:protein SCO1